MKRLVRSSLILSLFVAAATILLVHRHPDGVRAQPPNENRLEYRVDRTLRERGIVESSRSVDVRCEVSGTSTILSVVPEGSQVDKGDLLVELDDAALRDQLAAAEVQVRQSEARVLRNQAELEAAQEDGAAAVRLAEQALEAALASRDRVLAEGGELEYERVLAESELAVATARLKTAEKLLEEALQDSESESLNELRLRQIEAREAIGVAEARKRLLEHDRKTRTAMLDLDLAEKRMQRTREERACEKARRLAEAELAAGEAALAEDRRGLERARQELERCRMDAPAAGVVLYARATASRTARGSAIEAGAEVREGQTLLRVADLNDLQLRVQVNESRIARVRRGQPAKIRLDAFPTRDYAGRVVHISKVPEPASWWNADVREYPVLVSLEEPTDSLRIGLTALVEILAGDTENPEVDPSP